MQLHASLVVDKLTLECTKRCFVHSFVQDKATSSVTLRRSAGAGDIDPPDSDAASRKTGLYPEQRRGVSCTPKSAYQPRATSVVARRHARSVTRRLQSAQAYIHGRNRRRRRSGRRGLTTAECGPARRPALQVPATARSLVVSLLKTGRRPQESHVRVFLRAGELPLYCHSIMGGAPACQVGCPFPALAAALRRRGSMR